MGVKAPTPMPVGAVPPPPPPAPPPPLRFSLPPGVERVAPGHYSIKLTVDGRSVELSAPTIEEVMEMARRWEAGKQ